MNLVSTTLIPDVGQQPQQGPNSLLSGSASSRPLVAAIDPFGLFNVIETSSASGPHHKESASPQPVAISSSQLMAAKCFLSVTSATPGLDSGLALLNSAAGLSFGSNTIQEALELQGGVGLNLIDSLADIPQTQSPSSWFTCSSSSASCVATLTTAAAANGGTSQSSETSRFLISPTDFLTLNPDDSSKIRRDVSLSSTSMLGGDVPVSESDSANNGGPVNSSFSCSDKLKSLVRDALSGSASAGNQKGAKRKKHPGRSKHLNTFCESPPNSIVLTSEDEDDDEDEGVGMAADSLHDESHLHHLHPGSHHHRHHTLRDHLMHKNSPLMCGVDVEVDEEEDDDPVVSHHTLPLSPNPSGSHYDDDLIIKSTSSLVGSRCQRVHSAPVCTASGTTEDEDDDLFTSLSAVNHHHHHHHTGHVNHANQDDSLIMGSSLISIPSLPISSLPLSLPLISTSSIDSHHHHHHHLVPNSHHHNLPLLDLCRDDGIHLLASNNSTICSSSSSLTLNGTKLTTSTGTSTMSSLFPGLAPISSPHLVPLSSLHHDVAVTSSCGSHFAPIVDRLVVTSPPQQSNSSTNISSHSNAGLLALLASSKAADSVLRSSGPVTAISSAAAASQTIALSISSPTTASAPISTKELNTIKTTSTTTKSLKPTMVTTTPFCPANSGPAPLTFAPPPLANITVKSEPRATCFVSSSAASSTSTSTVNGSAFQLTSRPADQALSALHFPEMMKIPIIGGGGLISKNGVLQLSASGGTKLSQASALGGLHSPTDHKTNAAQSTFALQVIRHDGTSIMVPMPSNPTSLAGTPSSCASSFAQTLTKFIQSSAANVHHLNPIGSGTPVTIIGTTSGLTTGTGPDQRKATTSTQSCSGSTILQAVKSAASSTLACNSHPAGSIFSLPTKVTIQIADQHHQQNQKAFLHSSTSSSNSNSSSSSSSASSSPGSGSRGGGGGGGCSGTDHHHHHHHHGSTSRPFKCELCNSTFTRLGNYTRHKKIHSLPTKEDQRFRCDVCSKSFIQRCDLARHLHIHRGTEPHRCPQCGKGYIRHSDLVTHQRFHNKEKPFGCPHCSKGFCQRGDLNRHLRSIHLQMKPVLCTFCHKKFAKEETLLRHINANHREQVHVVQATAAVAAAAAPSLDLTPASSSATNGTATATSAAAALNGILTKNHAGHHQIISISSSALKGGQVLSTTSGGAVTVQHLSLSSLLGQHAAAAGGATVVKTLAGNAVSKASQSINLVATSVKPPTSATSVAVSGGSTKTATSMGVTLSGPLTIKTE